MDVNVTKQINRWSTGLRSLVTMTAANCVLVSLGLL